MMSKKRIVACPVCQKDSEYSPDNPYRPFCSERCQLIDFGDWAEERHRIENVTPPDDDQEYQH